MPVCPCSSGKAYEDCCAPFLSAKAKPLTPEQLMRSRYTAYVEANFNYIAATMKPPASEGFDLESVKAAAEKIKWIGLEVIHSTQEGTQGIVEFRASYLVGKKKYVLEERSDFEFDSGSWFYVDGH